MKAVLPERNRERHTLFLRPHKFLYSRIASCFPHIGLSLLCFLTFLPARNFFAGFYAENDCKK